MKTIKYLICLYLLIASCDNYQYYLPNKNSDMSELDARQTSSNFDSMADNSYIFTMGIPKFAPKDYYGNSETCNIDINLLGNFTFPPGCKNIPQNGGPVEYIPKETQCISLLSLTLENPKSLIPDTSQGNWKLLINGSYKARNFFALQSKEPIFKNFAYWLDGMEIYAKSGTSHRLLGTIQGNDWSQNDPSKFDVILFERQLPSGMKIDAIDVRFTRRCVKSNSFEFNTLDSIPSALISDLLSKFIIDNIAFVKIP